MILTDEQIKADDERWKCRDVKQELRYIGYATPTRTSVTNDDIKFVACMARKALRMIEHGMGAYRIDADGTLWIPVASLDELDKISRVIVEHGTWCKQFYMDAQPELRTETLKAEIRRMKRSFTICNNSDYYTGYMSALSAVEGYIAKMEGDAE